MEVYKVKSSEYHYIYDKNAQPFKKIKSGETILIETEDAYRGLIKKEEDMTPETIDSIHKLSCPLSGPIYLEDSKPGDWLEIHIDNIEIKGYGALLYGGDFTCIPHFLVNWVPAVAKVENNYIYYTEKVKFPAKPLIGTIGTTPSLQAPLSGLQGIWGGNMDCPLVCKDNILYLPVFIEGAYLYMGDVHAIQGEGELINPFESPAKITLTIKLIKNKSSVNRWPRIITNDSIVTIYTDRTAEKGIQGSLIEMLFWLEHEFNFSKHEAVVLCALVANGRVCQIVDTLCTSMCVLEKVYL